MESREVLASKPIDKYTKILKQFGDINFVPRKSDQLLPAGIEYKIFDNYDTWRSRNPLEHESRLRDYVKKEFPAFHSRATRVFKDQPLLQTHSCTSATMLASGDILVGLVSDTTYSSIIAEITPNLPTETVLNKPPKPVKLVAKFSSRVRQVIIFKELLILTCRDTLIWQADLNTPDVQPTKTELTKTYSLTSKIQPWGELLVYLDRDSRPIMLDVSAERQLKVVGEIKGERRDTFLAVCVFKDYAYFVSREGKHGDIVVEKRHKDKPQVCQKSRKISIRGGLAAGIERALLTVSEDHVLVSWKQSELTSHHQKSMSYTTELVLLSGENLLVHDSQPNQYSLPVVWVALHTVRHYRCAFAVSERENIALYCVDHNKLRLVGNIRSMFGSDHVVEGIFVEREEVLLHPLTQKPLKSRKTALVLFGSARIIDELRF